jgi:glycosyltransferase involved in cell wall biosynthesis
MSLQISVCLISYNGEKYIKKQMESILNQTHFVDEIIISDNGSTDKTIEIVKSFKADRINFFNNIDKDKDSRKRIIQNVEFALNQAQGNFIFLADQDDIWFPKKVEIMMEYLKKKTLVISDSMLIDESGNIISDSFFKQSKFKFNFPFDLIRNPYSGCAMAFKKELLAFALPFPKSIPLHDIWLGNVAKYFFSVKVIGEPLMYYRRHDENSSSSGKKSEYSFLKKISFRIVLVVSLIKYGFNQCLLNKNNFK